MVIGITAPGVTGTFNDVNPVGVGYQTTPTITFSSPGTGNIADTATALAILHTDIDKPGNFGQNNEFKLESNTFLDFSESNPFGDVVNGFPAQISTTVIRADSTTITADSTVITVG